MENSISQIHLLSVHLNAEKDSVIRNLEDIRAVMSVSYKICDSNAINLMFLTTVNEKEQCLFHLKCEYAFLCHDYQNEKEMIMSAVSVISPKVEEIIALMTSQIKNKQYKNVTINLYVLKCRKNEYMIHPTIITIDVNSFKER